ncbi:DUF1385 domain-containing protein [Candidatus Woesearchaeota archaeon]|nr:DUF1385 domain-containing protein [Candidatus Woesearchaeota archaeon]
MSHKIGGQAVIEGVMMKSDNRYSVAVRSKTNKITLKKEKFVSVTEKSKILKLPLIRGLFILIETLILGLKVLSYSVDMSAKDEGEELSRLSLILTIGFSVLMAIGLFIALPLFLTKIITRAEGFLFNLIDGIFRLVIFLVYVVSISLLKDVRRIFEYHGAEHMAVNCYDAKKKLTLENVNKYSTLHPRCGTAFLMIVLIISILVFSLIPTSSFLMRLLTRILLFPVIAGISYEVLKLSDTYRKSRFIWLVSLPGLAMQKITTRKPDNNQIEVAVTALKALIK